jgi:hypothetical protein
LVTFAEPLIDRILRCEAILLHRDITDAERFVRNQTFAVDLQLARSVVRHPDHTRVQMRARIPTAVNVHVKVFR